MEYKTRDRNHKLFVPGQKVRDIEYPRYLAIVLSPTEDLPYKKGEIRVQGIRTANGSSAYGVCQWISPDIASQYLYIVETVELENIRPCSIRPFREYKKMFGEKA